MKYETKELAWSNYTEHGYFLGLVLSAKEEDRQEMQKAFEAGFEDGNNKKHLVEYKTDTRSFGKGNYSANLLDFYIAGVFARLDASDYTEWADSLEVFDETGKS